MVPQRSGLADRAVPYLLQRGMHLFVPAVHQNIREDRDKARPRKEEAKRQFPERTAPENLLDERFIKTPTIAVGQANRAVTRMAETAMESLKTAFDGFVARDEEAAERVSALNANVADLERRIVSFLIRISSEITSETDERTIYALHHATGDIARISELADNITKYTRSCCKKGIDFSPVVIKSLHEMYGKIEELYGKTMEVFDKKGHYRHPRRRQCGIGNRRRAQRDGQRSYRAAERGQMQARVERGVHQSRREFGARGRPSHLRGARIRLREKDLRVRGVHGIIRAEG